MVHVHVLKHEELPAEATLQSSAQFALLKIELQLKYDSFYAN